MMHSDEVVRPLNAKEASYLCTRDQFTNFAFGLTLAGVVVSRNDAANALESVARRNPLLRVRVALRSASLVFVARKAPDVVVADDMVVVADSAVRLDSHLEAEISTPIPVLAHTARLTIIPREGDTDVIFTFAHAAFDAMCASTIVADWIHIVTSTPLPVSQDMDPLQNVTVPPNDMIPTSERTWPNFFRFLWTVASLQFWIFMYMPVLLKVATPPEDIRAAFKDVVTEEAKNMQLTRLTTHFLGAEETKKVVTRAKTLGVTVSGLIVGSLAAAIASDKLLPSKSPKAAKSSQTQAQKMALLAAIAVNGRPGLDIPSTHNGSFNYGLLVPLSSVTIVSEKSVAVEAAIQSTRANLDLKRRLLAKEPLHLARFLPTYDPFKNPVAEGCHPPAMRLAPAKPADALPVAFVLSNLGSVRVGVPAVRAFRMVSTLRPDINTRRVEVNVVSVDGLMSVTFAHLNGMVLRADLELLVERFLLGLLGDE
ncbi:hypothetical protein BC830DRAFT_1139286 [Chytriomyces sp. MP71]|nr:hypothetical protein BC830DRAFT_1139286 [Chytriomyces sp. MP71]